MELCHNTSRAIVVPSRRTTEKNELWNIFKNYVDIPKRKQWIHRLIFKTFQKYKQIWNLCHNYWFYSTVIKWNSISNHYFLSRKNEGSFYCKNTPLAPLIIKISRFYALFSLIYAISFLFLNFKTRKTRFNFLVTQKN